MSLNEKFEAAAATINAFTKRPTDDEFLQVYALYKQATIGDVNIEKPGVLDLKGKAKWAAWSEKKGTSQDAAKEAYIKLIGELAPKYS